MAAVGDAPVLDEDEQEDVVATLENLEVDDSTAIATGIDTLKDFLQAKRTSDEIVEEVRRIQTNSALPIGDRIRIFIDGAFSEHYQTDLTKYKKCLVKLIKSNEDQLILILTLLRFYSVVHSTKKSFPIVMAKLFENDILSEDVILAWYSSDKDVGMKDVSKSLVKEMKNISKPFIVWLENAEEESDEE